MALMFARCHLEITIGKFWGKNKGLLLTGSGNYIVHLRQHREVAGRETVCEFEFEVPLLLGLRVGA